MLEKFSLENSVAFVTGAGSGIGQAIACAWAEAGADVACFDLDRDSAERTVDRILAEGRRAVALAGDVTDPETVARAVGQTVEQLGALDLALNNAGISQQVPAEDMSIEDWDRMISVNLTGVFVCAQAEARHMLAHGGGSIVNTASMSGTIANRDLHQVHYNSAKAGVKHLTSSLAAEWAEHGIRVNSISPGYTATPLTQQPELAPNRAKWAAETPMGRMVEVEEITGPATFLASRAASAVTGADLLIDCGYTCW